jgi:hypothetical protein
MQMSVHYCHRVVLSYTRWREHDRQDAQVPSPHLAKDGTLTATREVAGAGGTVQRPRPSPPTMRAMTRSEDLRRHLRDRDSDHGVSCRSTCSASTTAGRPRNSGPGPEPYAVAWLPTRPDRRPPRPGTLRPTTAPAAAPPLRRGGVPTRRPASASRSSSSPPTRGWSLRWRAATVLGPLHGGKATDGRRRPRLRPTRVTRARRAMRPRHAGGRRGRPVRRNQRAHSNGTGPLPVRLPDRMSSTFRQVWSSLVGLLPPTAPALAFGAGRSPAPGSEPHCVSSGHPPTPSVDDASNLPKHFFRRRAA